MTTRADDTVHSPSPHSDRTACARRKRIALVGGGLLAGAFLLLAGWHVYRGRLDREAALALYRSGREREAEPLLRRVLGRRADDVEILKALAQISLDGQAPESAEPRLVQWTRLCPEDAEPWKLLLELYRKQEKYEPALEASRAVLQREPNDPAIQRRLAELCVSTGHFEDAGRALQLCLDRQPNDRSLRLLLAEVKRGQGQTAEAEAILQKLLQEQPRYTAALMLAGILYRETGRPEKAIPLLEQVLLQDPRRGRSARYQLTMALEQAGRHDDARRMAVALRRMQDIQVLRELLPSRPDDLDLKVRLADMLLEEGQVEEGRRLLEEVQAADPRFEAAKKARAQHLAK